MGFLKKIFGDAADELKKNLEDAKKKMSNNLKEMKRNAMAGFNNSTSNSRDYDEEDDEKPKILLGDFHDGVLTIREGITELDDESLEHYKRIRKIIFPASLESLDSNVIDEQERLEELDFSKVTKLKTIPDDFISGENKIRKLIIPNGVTEVGDGFLGEAKSGAEIFVPASVRKLGYITGNNDNDMTVYLFAANIDISDVEEDVKTLYVLPDYYGYYAKQLKECDSEARLREMPEEMMGVYGATSLGELKEIAKDNASLAEDSKTESEVEVEQKEEPIENGGLFSARLEAMIAAVLQDGVLTDKERELLKRRVEKEGEDWDEVEMIVEARLAEMNPVASIPSSRTSENNNLSKDTTPQAIEQKKRQIEEQAKAKEVPALKVDKPISKEYVRTNEDKYATSIDIPEGVTIIPGRCFYGCSSMESITLPSTIKQIGERAFDGCSALTSIDIPEGVTIIPGWCFCGCSSMESITLPSTIKQIGENAFNGCSALTSIDIPEGVTIISEWCFCECKNLNSVTLPSTIKKIGKRAFYGCSALTSIDIPEGVTIIPDYCFYGCSSMESITLPSTIKQIGERAFDGCSALTSIDIPEGVTIIPGYCFDGCSSMESITLPSTIKQIGKRAFDGFSALTSIDIPEGVTIIPDYCFYGCSSMESITLPSTIKQIGERAFDGCSALTSIDIPEGVTIISKWCFCKCKKLNSVTLPTTIKKIENSAFYECNKVKTISIPNGCERLEELGYIASSPRIFLPPSLCSIDVISTGNELLIYCFAPQLEELEIFENCQELYVLPQYLDLYKSQAKAERVKIDIKPMPDEYLYFYDN